MKADLLLCLEGQSTLSFRKDLGSMLSGRWLRNKEVPDLCEQAHKIRRLRKRRRKDIQAIATGSTVLNIRLSLFVSTRKELRGRRIRWWSTIAMRKMKREELWTRPTDRAHDAFDDLRISLFFLFCVY